MLLRRQTLAINAKVVLDEVRIVDQRRAEYARRTDRKGVIQLGTRDGTPQIGHTPSFFFNISLTTAGFALPPVAFMV